MSRVKVERVTCDVCGVISHLKPGDIGVMSYRIPVSLVGEDTGSMGCATIDLCNDCASKLALIEVRPNMEYDPTAYKEYEPQIGKYIYTFKED